MKLIILIGLLILVAGCVSYEEVDFCQNYCIDHDMTYSHKTQGESYLRCVCYSVFEREHSELPVLEEVMTE